MATNKNITMKQFNGTDYDTLYPKTIVSQVDNALNKTGDTMTGQLNVPAFALTNYNAALEIGKNIDFHAAGSTNDYDARLTYESGKLLFGLRRGEFNTILHTGNLEDLSIAKIATGSYVGTGTYGPDNKNSLTFPFNPKFVAIWMDNATVGPLFVFISEKSNYTLIRSSGGSYSRNCSFDGNTLSWWSGDGSYGTGDKEIQANSSGVTYNYVALG